MLPWSTQVHTSLKAEKTRYGFSILFRRLLQETRYVLGEHVYGSAIIPLGMSKYNHEISSPLCYFDTAMNKPTWVKKKFSKLETDILICIWKKGASSSIRRTLAQHQIRRIITLIMMQLHPSMPPCILRRVFQHMRLIPIHSYRSNSIHQHKRSFDVRHNGSGGIVNVWDFT
mmetsp:Transcript_32161/g.46856  ORF Transcript_32161/g.46856 Transcript_32161/m.46856 type:complete len:172 (+) Transcript_32161:92-607(+)